MTTQELMAKTLQTLTSRVRPTTSPIGVKLLKSAEQLPAKYKSPKKMGNAGVSVKPSLLPAALAGWSFSHQKIRLVPWLNP